MSGELGSIGVDEVGRGALAGPVVVCAFAARPGATLDALGAHVRDSKRLTTRARRNAAAAAIEGLGVWVLAWRGVDVIDEMNIRGATLCAMREAVEALRARLAAPAMPAVIDGRDVPAGLPHATPVIGGDGSVPEISCASVLAKVARDAHMDGLGAECPGFGFDRNAGYGTQAHRGAIARLGLCRHHRSWARRFLSA